MGKEREGFCHVVPIWKS